MAAAAAAVGPIIGAIGAGTSVAGSIYGAAKGGGASGAKALFPGVQEGFMKQLTGGGNGGLSSGFGPVSMGTLTEMSRSGMPTNVGPMFEALLQSQSRFNQQGRGNILEQFGSSGLRYSKPMMDALVDYESQLSSNYGSILAQYVYQAMEAARGRQLQAAAIGTQAYGTPALAMQGQRQPGMGISNVGESLAGFGKYLTGAFK